MFILLSEQQKKRLFREYRMRLFAVLCFLFAGLFFISAGLLLPSYLALRAEQNDLESQNTNYQKQIALENGKGLTSTLGDIKGMVGLVTPDKTALLTTIETVLADKPGDVSIVSFSYTHGGQSDSTLALQGVATSRSSLLSFSKALQKESSFSGVTLPVGNLAKDINVPYSLGISGKF